MNKNLFKQIIIGAVIIILGIIFFKTSRPLNEHFPDASLSANHEDRGTLPIIEIKSELKSINGNTFPPIELFEVKGRLLATGQNTTPEGLYQIRTYRIEEIGFKESIEVQINYKKRFVDRAFRVIIYGDNFPLRSLHYNICSGEFPVGIWAGEMSDAFGIDTITFDSSVLHEGAVLRAGYEISCSKGLKGELYGQELREPIHYLNRSK